MGHCGFCPSRGGGLAARRRADVACSDRRREVSLVATILLDVERKRRGNLASPFRRLGRYVELSVVVPSEIARIGKRPPNGSIGLKNMNHRLIHQSLPSLTFRYLSGGLFASFNFASSAALRFAVRAGWTK